MPRGDGTGPAGMGRLTGRSAGFCAGFKTPGFINMGFGRCTESGRGPRFRRIIWLASLLFGCGYLCLSRGQLQGKKVRKQST